MLKITALTKTELALNFVYAVSCVRDCSGNPFLIRPFGEVKKIEAKGATLAVTPKKYKFIYLSFVINSKLLNFFNDYLSLFELYSFGKP